MSNSSGAGSKKTVGLYVDIDPDLKYQLERIAFERSGPGSRVSLRTIVGEALRQYVALQQEYSGRQSQGEHEPLG